MQTEAQRRATSNYRKKVKQLTLRFYPNSDADEEMYEWLKSQDNTTDYIKKLISADMQNADRRLAAIAPNLNSGTVPKLR